ncbi:hypothetical protein KUL156_31370 [Alteromonas sp. KUL156]|nr:hypothetical protein KUL154_51230 [Alteromonas sp. KUL154]GFE00545.1 hypothetical protein KUL156_31370 [Alteromonas sp. KUL156]
MHTLDNNKTLSKEQLWNRDAAISRLGGNEGLLNRIVDMFLAQIEQKHDALIKAVAEMNLEAVRFTSHSMKGASGDVGADAIRGKAAAIEMKAKQDDTNSLHEDMRELHALISQTIKVMRSEN